MDFSQMSAREKAIIVVLGVVIVAALIGIGVLVAKLVSGDDTAEITTAPTTGGEVPPQVTITLVATPALDEPPQETPNPVSDQPVAIAQAEGAGPGLPVIIADQPLYAGRRYRIEIKAADGSNVAVQGSWSQAATSASGQVAAPQIEFFEGTTPHTIDVVSPVADPSLWSCSVSAAPKDILAKPTNLVIVVYDVTGSQ